MNETQIIVEHQSRFEFEKTVIKLEILLWFSLQMRHLRR